MVVVYAYAATAVCCNQQLSGTRKSLLTHLVPPATDAVDSKLRSVVVDPHANPSLVVKQIVHAVGSHLTERLDQEVVNTHLFRLTFGKPLLPDILEISDLFLLFRIHRDHRLAAFQESLHAGVDVFELGISIRMRCSLPRLPVPLQAVVRVQQQLGHRTRTDRMVLPRQLVGQTAGTLTCPAQRRLGITTRRGLDQGFQCSHQPGVGLCQRHPTAAESSHASGLGHAFLFRQRQFTETCCDGRTRHTSGLSHRRNPTPAQFTRFRCCPLPPQAFVHLRFQRLVFRLNPCNDLCILHAHVIKYSAKWDNTNLFRLFVRGCLLGAAARKQPSL